MKTHTKVSPLHTAVMVITRVSVESDDKLPRAPHKGADLVLFLCPHTIHS